MIFPVHPMLLVLALAVVLFASMTLPIAYRVCLKYHGEVWRPCDWAFVCASVIVGLPFWLGALLPSAGGRILAVGGSGILLSFIVLLIRRLYRVTTVLVVITFVGSLLLLLLPSTEVEQGPVPKTASIVPFLMCMVTPIAWLLGLVISFRFDASPPNLWKRPRLLRPKRCPQCQYDLTAIIAARCPECGFDVWAQLSERGKGDGR